MSRSETLRSDREVASERDVRTFRECGEKATGDDKITCRECGLVIAEDTLDRGPEWSRFHSDESNPARTGPPRTATRHDNGLSTVIGRYTDAAGNVLTARKKYQLNRIREHHKRSEETWPILTRPGKRKTVTRRNASVNVTSKRNLKRRE